MIWTSHKTVILRGDLNVPVQNGQVVILLVSTVLNQPLIIYVRKMRALL